MQKSCSAVILGNPMAALGNRLNFEMKDLRETLQHHTFISRSKVTSNAGHCVAISCFLCEKSAGWKLSNFPDLYLENVLADIRNWGIVKQPCSNLLVAR